MAAEESSTGGGANAESMVWEPHALFLSVAVAGLGDWSLEDDDSWRTSGQPALAVRSDGCGMICGYAAADGMPVEIARSGGALVGARVEYVDDVDELEASREGRWETLGVTRIGDRGAIARGLEDGPDVVIDDSRR